MRHFKRLPFSSAPNARDLGGVPLPGGGQTRWGVFYRSAAPTAFTPEDLALCKSQGISHVIDLRAPGGYSPFREAPGIAYHNFPLTGPDQNPQNDEDVPRTYMAMVDKQETFRGIFQTLSAAEGACLYHCFAGKDRTGMVSALLLLLAGAGDADILADYAASYPYVMALNRAEAERRGEAWQPYVESLCWAASRPEFLEHFLWVFREKYGTAGRYLSRIGLTEPEISRLRQKLREDR